MALSSITPQSVNRFACLIVGPAGIGKTSLLRTLCGQYYTEEGWKQYDGVEPERVCVLSAESGLLCVRDLVVTGQVQGYEISSLADFQEAQRLCMSQDFKSKGYRWIFIDSLTEIAARCSEALQEKYKNDPNGYKLWGEYNTKMTDIIKAFRDVSDYNVIFTCLEAYEKDRDGILRTVPDMSGTQLKNRLTSYFDEVFHMERVKFEDGNELTMFDTRKMIGLSKDRSGKLAPYEYPNLLSIQHKILG